MGDNRRRFKMSEWKMRRCKMRARRTRDNWRNAILVVDFHKPVFVCM